MHQTPDTWKRLVMRPLGVASKNDMGERSTPHSAAACSLKLAATEAKASTSMRTQTVRLEPMNEAP
jgi:hypothetical protein